MIPGNRSGTMEEKFPHQSHVLFEGHTANQVAGIVKVHNFDVGLLGRFFANHWLSSWRWKSPGMFHDQSMAGHPLQQFIRFVLFLAGPEIQAGPCEVEIEQRISLDHWYI